MIMRPTIHSIYASDCVDLRRWVPKNNDIIAKFIAIDIGRKDGKGSDIFSILVTTPKGVQTLTPKNGILASHPLVVVEKYDFAFLSRWLENKVSSCEADSWLHCANQLNMYFGWEFDYLHSDCNNTHKFKPIIYSIYTNDHVSLRKWAPENDDIVAKSINFDVGGKGKTERSTFSILVATPRGLQTLTPKSGILASHPLVVMDRYNFNFLFQWLEETVSSCEADSWFQCVDRLKVYFNWESDCLRTGA